MIIKRAGAVFDKNQLEVISKIEPFTTGLDIEATRGHSTPVEQLEIIEQFANRFNCMFPEFVPGLVDVKKEIPGVGLVYLWQRTWSALLRNVDPKKDPCVVVNPPIATICLENYTRPNGEQMKGKTIEASSHCIGERNGEFPIDFSQKVNGVPNLSLVSKIIERAQSAGCGISFVRIEHANGCAHAGTLKVV